jgi:hypothetical protein
MKHRKRRIAFSAVCGIACLMLSMLWVRSWSRLDRLDIPVSRFLSSSTIAAASLRGVLMIGVQQRMHAVYPDPRTAWRFSSGPIDPAAVGNLQHGRFGFTIIRTQRESGVQLPIWFVATVPAICSSIPWIRWRRQFSLRALLISATLVAMALGLLVARSR